MSLLGVLLRIEALKAVKRPAFCVTLGIFVAIVTTYVVTVFSEQYGALPSPYRAVALPEGWRYILPTNFGPAFLGVSMILLFAPEFSWRTARQQVIDGLSRERVYLGKVMLLLVLVALFLAIPLLLGGGAAIVSPSEDGPVLVRHTEFNYMLGYTLVLGLAGSAGLMLAALVRSSGPALGIFFVYTLIEASVGSLLGRWSDALQPITKFFPLVVCDSLTNALLHYPELLASENANRAAYGRELMEFLDFEVLAVTALAYAALFLGIAFLSMRQRDL